METFLNPEQKRKIVAKLIVILNDVPAGQVLEVMSLTKVYIDMISERLKIADLIMLFNKQIQNLRDRGCPELIIEMLNNQRIQVIKKARKITITQGNIPFLPVIPEKYLSIHSQMPMVKNDSKKGYTFLNLSEITDVIKTPKDPYYIFNIGDGELIRNKTPHKAEKLIKKQGHRCLTVVEVIALSIHTNVLSRHYVHAIGSRYESKHIPGLYLIDNFPAFRWVFSADILPYWGSASCNRN